MRNRKRITGLGLAIICSVSLLGCQTQMAETSTSATTSKATEMQNNDETRIFVDSAGREVVIPAEINTVAPSGQVAQMILYTAVPDKLTGIAVAFRDEAKAYIDERYTTLPLLGQFYGKNANLNMEELVKVNPDVIIDIGEKKGSIVEDLDQLQEQINIPVIFIEATTDTMDETYKKLGELFAEEEKMQVLGAYCKAVTEHAKDVSAQLSDDQKVSVYIAREENGLGTDASGSFHAESLDLVGAINAADVEAAGKGGGSIVSMEQILVWNPDVILVYTQDVYDEITTSDVWVELEAVKEGKVYLIPSGPYNFISNPPSVNRMIGIAWLGNRLYPERYAFTEEMVTEFYELFYHITPTAEQLETLR